MPRLSAFVAWCCGTTVSAAIAWFGVAGAVDTAVSPELRIAVPSRSDVEDGGRVQAVGAPTADDREDKPDPKHSARKADRSPEPSSGRDKRQQAKSERDGSVVVRTVRGGSATFFLQPTGAVLISATPAPGHTASVRRQYKLVNGTRSGSLEVRFTGADETSSIMATWDGKTVDITTKGR